MTTFPSSRSLRVHQLRRLICAVSRRFTGKTSPHKPQLAVVAFPNRKRRRCPCSLRYLISRNTSAYSTATRTKRATRSNHSTKSMGTRRRSATPSGFTKARTPRLSEKLRGDITAIPRVVARDVGPAAYGSFRPPRLTRQHRMKRVGHSSLPLSPQSRPKRTLR